MRTIFEDVDERTNREDDGKEGRTAILLWLVAILSIGAAWGTYRWITHRRAALPPPPPVSLNDDNQLSTTLNQFNGFVKAGNWEEAQKMLSSEGIKRLEDEQKTLRESLLGERSKDEVVEALLTPSLSRTPSTVRIDCGYLFADRQTKIIPLTLVIENGRLMVNSW